MKASNNLNHFYKFACQAAGQTVPSSPIKNSPTTSNRSRSSQPKKSPANQDTNNKLSLNDSQSRQSRDVLHKLAPPNRISKSPGEKNLSSFRNEKDGGSQKELKVTQRDSQGVFSSERASEGSRNIEQKSEMKTNHQQQKVTDVLNGKSEQGTNTEKGIEIIGQNKNIVDGKQDTQKEKSTQRQDDENPGRVQKETQTSHRLMSNGNEDLDIEEKISLREKGITANQQQDSEEPKNNVSFHKSQAVTKQDYFIRQETFEPHNNIDISLEHHKEEGYGNKYERISEKNSLRQAQRKVKEYRERNPYPCYEQMSFKGIISRKNKSKSRLRKAKNISKEEADAYEIQQASFCLLKDIEMEDKQPRRVATEIETPYPSRSQIRNKINKSVLEPRKNELKRGRKKLAPIAKSSTKSFENSVTPPKMLNLDYQTKVNHVKQNILRCSSTRRMSSLEREKENDQLEVAKKEEIERQNKRIISADISLPDMRKTKHHHDSKEFQVGGDTSFVRNAIAMEKLKENYTDYLEKKKIIPKAPPKQSKPTIEKQINIRNVYGIENPTQKLEMIIKTRLRGTSVVEDTPDTSPIIHQRSSSVIGHARDKNLPKEISSLNQKSLKSINSPNVESPLNNMSNAHNKSVVEQMISERGNPDAYINLIDKRSNSTFNRAQRTCLFEANADRSPGPKYDLSSYQAISGKRREFEVEEYYGRVSDTKGTTRSYYSFVKHTEEDGDKDFQLTSYLQPSSQMSTYISGKGVNFGKSKREILCPLKSENPGPGKYDTPVLIQKGTKFGRQRKSLKFSFPKLKDVKIANPVELTY